MDIVRHSAFGYFLRGVSGGRVCPFPSCKYAKHSNPASEELGSKSTNANGDLSNFVVDWDGPDDPENPQNWSVKRKSSIAVLICMYTFSVYVGSSIYAPAETQIMEEFQVGPTASSLGLALYVLFYGIGTLLFSPLSEIPVVGRTLPYVTTFSVFVILLVPTALSQTFPGLLVLRCLLAFFGSPCLATSGATFQDLFPPRQLPYVVAIWSAVATSGPALGPLLASYSVAAEGWRWTHWELLWLGGPVLLCMVLTLPETSAVTILTRRARRLRAETGDKRFRAQAEIDQGQRDARGILFDALVKPWEINVLDPAVLYSTFFTGLLYGIVYTWFEVFPIVYGTIYGFESSAQGLPFLAVFVSLLFWVPAYMTYVKFSVERKIDKHGLGAPEEWLIIGIVAGWLIPAGLFIFAFSSREDVHWVVSLVGVALSNTGACAAMQSMFLYVPSCYPKYAASLLSANALARSIFATGAILYAPAMFDAMGVPGGVSMLAGLTVLFWGGLSVLSLWGRRLRSGSRFAV
ncbi:major facilitator superfamily domain-containing protein [Xylariales sp. PMI_506]|nr:major facilitator superfamily domain-containing protein [Xylariales sp. PMI_506]